MVGVYRLIVHLTQIKLGHFDVYASKLLASITRALCQM